MALAEGWWAWWNQYGTVPVATCARRAREAGLRGVIVKHGYREARDAFARAGVPWATERYVYPGQPEAEARRLAEDVSAGARFAVVNAEVEWETLGPEAMRRLAGEFRRLQPRAELYACVDTRGERTALPYQRVLAEQVSGWLPMVYPLAFRPARPAGYVAQAFRDAIDGPSTASGHRFAGKPVLPVIQTYGGIGAGDVRAQVEEVRRRGLRGAQAYTIAHASDAEWSAFVAATAEGEEMREVEALSSVQAAAGLFLQAAGHALRGEWLPAALRAQLRYLLG